MTDEAAIETLLAEERRYPPPADFAAGANAQSDLYELPADARRKKKLLVVTSG